MPRRVAETIDWVAREMRLPGGGFASSLDADSEHEEGKFYVWSAAEIDALLGARAARFKEIYDVAAGGNWEGEDHPQSPASPRARRRRRRGASWRRAAAILLEARGGRVRPGLDDKVLADWNGLMIAALAAAGMAFARADWIALAERAFAFVVGEHERGGRPPRACLARGQARAPRDARRLRQHEPRGAAAARGDRRAGVSRGGARAGSRSATRITGTRAAAISSPPTTPRRCWCAPSRRRISRTRRATARSSRCWRGSITSPATTRYRARAEEILAAFAGEAQRNLFGLATLLNGGGVPGARDADRRDRRARGRGYAGAARARSMRPACRRSVLSVVSGAARIAAGASRRRQGHDRRPRDRLSLRGDACARCRSPTPATLAGDARPAMMRRLSLETPVRPPHLERGRREASSR